MLQIVWLTDKVKTLSVFFWKFGKIPRSNVVGSAGDYLKIANERRIKKWQVYGTP